MKTYNDIQVRAPLEICLEAARDVERWPEILPHYRDVRFLRKDGPGRGRVHMSAFRHFGPLPYPVWWESEMVTDHDEAEVRYRHVDGITTGMEVSWSLEEAAPEAPQGAGGTGTAVAGGGRGGAGTDGRARDTEAPAERGSGSASARRPLTRIVILHEWDGPGWPVIGGFAARRVIGPHFVHVVADRTLAGIRRAAEARADGGGAS